MDKNVMRFVKGLSSLRELFLMLAFIIVVLLPVTLLGFFVATGIFISSAHLMNVFNLDSWLEFGVLYFGQVGIIIIIGVVILHLYKPRPGSSEKIKRFLSAFHMEDFLKNPSG